MNYGLSRVIVSGSWVANASSIGNCLFRSLSFLLYNTQEHHAQLRAEAVHYIEEHRDMFKQFMASDDILGESMEEDYELIQERLERKLEAHVSKMEQDGQWGGHEEIFALASVHNY